MIQILEITLRNLKYLINNTYFCLQNGLQVLIMPANLYIGQHIKRLEPTDSEPELTI